MGERVWEEGGFRRFGELRLGLRGLERVRVGSGWV